MKSKVLEALEIVLPMIKEIFHLDVQIYLTDLEKTLDVWYADSFRMEVEVGEILDASKPGHDQVLLAIETGKQNSGILPEFVYGVAVNGIVTPVFENRKVVGVVIIARSIQKDLQISHAAETLNGSLLDIEKITKEIADNASILAQRMSMIRSTSEIIGTHVNDTSNIVSKIKANSRKSNILAINASIEAARAGHFGAGFSIVAAEMGKLSTESESSTKQISEELSSVFDELDQIFADVTDVANIAEKQASIIEEIVASIEVITSETEHMVGLSKVG